MPLAWMNRDGKLILAEKAVRTVPYGFLGVLFAVYLHQAGFDDFRIGIIIAVTVATSAFYTFLASILADRLGRRRSLVFFAIMDFIAGSLLFSTTAWWAPVLAGIVGNMTVGAGEVGPFLSLEQAILPGTSGVEHRTFSFSIYNLIGYGASSIGALLAGLPPILGQGLSGYRPLFFAYLASGLIGGFLYSRLSKGVEVQTKGPGRRPVLSQKGRSVVEGLAGLFAVDAFAGGFIGQAILSYYFFQKYNLQLSSLGILFAVTQIITALSFLLAARIARRIGLLNTMVVTHLPSNILLTSIAFAPSVTSAVGLLFCRQSLSQMDVPTRQSYIVAVVEESDRTAAAGLTNLSRSTAQSVSPSLAGYLMADVSLGSIFVVAGSLKIAYDLAIYRSFRHLKPPEEASRNPK